MNQPVNQSQFNRRAPLRRGPIVALDVGTSKVACLIGEHNINPSDDAAQAGLLRILGSGHQLSEGLIGRSSG